MSGTEHTDNFPAQFSTIDENSVDNINKQVESLVNNNEGFNIEGLESVPSSCFELAEDKVSVLSNNCGEVEGCTGGNVNWDLGQQALNSVQAVGEVLDVCPTGFQGSEPPEMGNSIVKSGTQQVDSGVGAGNIVEEQLPISGCEDVSCKPDGEMVVSLSNEEIPGNSLGANETVGGVREMGVNSSNEEILGNSIGAVETVGGVPNVDDGKNYCDAGKVGDENANGEIEETQKECCSSQKSENKVLEPLEVASWASICDVAKASEETAELLFTENEKVQPQDLTGEFPCSVTVTSNLFSGTTVSERMIHGAGFEHATEIQKEAMCPSALGDQSEQKGKTACEDEQDDTKIDQNAQRSLDKHAGKSYLVVGKSAHGIEEDKAAACDMKDSQVQLCRSLLEILDEKGRVVVLGMPANDGSQIPRSFRTPAKKTSLMRYSSQNPGKASAITEKRSSQRLTSRSTKVLNSSSEENPIALEPGTTGDHTKRSSEETRGRKQREIKGKSQDEFSKMRRHLRYLLNRIRYEQNLLEAYSSEGWRGQSLEKLRPEKELQRAKADINRSKLKIRALFQRLDSISAEGKFPDSLYDSEGLIDSEDIFCAKCGSKDLPTGNDIILCDGNCDRGFHQYCLEPPLLTEEIPPGDEGWLCPACDCRADFIDVLNDSEEAKLSIEDSWEKVFPEAVAAMAGNEQDLLMGLPSDDSEDNDYDPDGPAGDPEVEGGEAGSDESDSDESDSSDFSSASEDLGAVRTDEQYLGLPSDDSEDDDFNPDAPNASNDDECESSSSDFSSASEDIGAAFGNDGMANNDEVSVPVDLDQDLGDSQPLSGRRHVERLDYKKLYDEAYGNAVSDSSDDDEWAENVSTRKRKTTAQKNAAASANGDVPVTSDMTSPPGTPRPRGRPKRNGQAVANTPAELQKTPQEISSNGSIKKRPPYNRLEDSITQRLLESFKENKYPDRAKKEKLAEELGLTPEKVNKWFGNARWSLSHHPTRIEASIARVLPQRTPPQTLGSNGGESASANNSTPQGGIADSSKLDIRGSDGGISTRSRKRKNINDNESVQQPLKADTANNSSPTHASPDTKATQLSGPEVQHERVKRRTRSSGL